MTELGEVKVGDEVVGHVNWERRIYITHRRRKPHYFRLYSGYGLSESVLAYLRKNRINRILLIEEDGGKETPYWFDTEDWIKHGSLWLDRKGRHQGDYTKDRQLILPLTHAKSE